MRLIDVVLGSVLLGLIAGFLHLAQPGAANANGAPEANTTARERITWLWTPALMRRSSSVQ